MQVWPSTDNGTDTVHREVEPGADYEIASDALSKQGPEMTLRQINMFNDFRFKNDLAGNDNRLAGVSRHFNIGELRLDSAAGRDITEHVRVFVYGENLTNQHRISNVGTNANQLRERATTFTTGQGRTCIASTSLAPTTRRSLPMKSTRRVLMVCRQPELRCILNQSQTCQR